MLFVQDGQALGRVLWAPGSSKCKVPGVRAQGQGRGGGPQWEMLRRQPGRPHRATDTHADWGCVLSQGEQRTGVGPGKHRPHLEIEAGFGQDWIHWPLDSGQDA